MSTRWWAPAANATCQLDATVSTMLEPGGDFEKDLGLYLLAAHRAGAGAMQSVAKREVISEGGIAMALAQVRRDLGPAMVDAIAPATGAAYAGVFVRDVLDAADQGAIDTYRSALAKGVAPPLALDRAAAVYGVPMRAMGAFPALPPTAQPRVVDDAADRALMSYVAKVAKSECASTAVAKAEPARQRSSTATATQTDFDPREHPRGTDGRFVDAPDVAPQLSPLERTRRRLGLSSTEPAQVAETTRTAKPTAAPAATTAATATTARTAARPKTQAKTGTKRQIKATGKTRRSQIRTRRRIQQQMATRLNRDTITAAPPASKKGARSPLVLPDLLKKIPDTRSDYYDIGQAVVLGLGQYDAAAIRTQASDQAMTQKDPSRRIFRLGYLLNEARYTEKAGAEAAKRHQSSAEREHYEHPDDYLGPQVSAIEYDELTGDPNTDMPYIENKRREAVSRMREMPNGEMRMVTDQSELRHVKALPVYQPWHVEQYDDYDRPMHDHPEWAVVHYLAHDMSHPNLRPIPTVDEYVIVTDARGREDGPGRQEQLTLDPNQIYEVVNAPDVRADARVQAEQMYDIDNEVVVNRWFLRPVDEYEIGDIIEGLDDDVDKALSGSQRTQFEQLHPRDEEGQWVSVLERTSLVAPTALPTARPAARTAATATTAQTATTARTATRPITARSARRVIRSIAQRPAIRTQAAPARTIRSIAEALQRKVTERVQEQKTPAPVLSDVRKYKLLRESFFQNLFPRTETSDEAFAALHRGMPLKLTNRQRLIVSQINETPLRVLPFSIAKNLNKAISEQRIPRETLAKIPLPQPSDGAIPDLDSVSEKVHWLLRSRPDLDVVELALDDDAENLMVFGSAVSGSYQNVVEYDPNLKMSGDLYLSFVGEHRAADMLAQGESATYSLIEDMVNADVDAENDGVIYNPYVHYYRLTSAPVRRFRLDKD